MKAKKLCGLATIGIPAILLIRANPVSGQSPDLCYACHTLFIDQGFQVTTATPSELCGACHQQIHREFATGFATDLEYPPMIYWSLTNGVLGLPAGVPGRATAHAYAGVDPWPIQARTMENHGQSCNVCHFPQPFAIPDMQLASIPRPLGRATNEESGGVTCASCHLGPDGYIRAAHLTDGGIAQWHHLGQDAGLQSSAMCAYCHSAGARVIGKQTQTFLEW